MKVKTFLRGSNESKLICVQHKVHYSTTGEKTPYIYMRMKMAWSGTVVSLHHWE